MTENRRKSRAIAFARSSRRVEHIDDEIKALNEGKKELFAEAKGRGVSM